MTHEINKLKESNKEQKDIIAKQQVYIESLNEIIINKDNTIEANEKNINKLKKDLSSKKKELKQKISSLTESEIKIDNLAYYKFNTKFKFIKFESRKSSKRNYSSS